MGRFCPNLKNTIEDDVKCAVVNLNLFLEDGCDKRSDYLLDFAKAQLESALTKLKAK